MTESTIRKYYEKLLPGNVFSKNQFSESIVEKTELAKNQNELFVITKSDNVKPFALAKVFVENNKLVHENLGSFLILTERIKRTYLQLVKNGKVVKLSMI
ncbi:hypothetical protein V8V91_17010 [Algoriphagus halophilus]|uniref:hypothetical protein n=1 Tax=Algoriphagus halophilus TaxID=226505 RepID=UPI00358E7388